MEHKRSITMLAASLFLAVITAQAQPNFLGVALQQPDPPDGIVNYLQQTPVWGYGAVCPFGPPGGIYVFSNARSWRSTCHAGAFWIESVYQDVINQIDMTGGMFNPVDGTKQANYEAYANCEPPWTYPLDDEGGPCGAGG